MSDLFGECRSVLARPPSAELFERLVELVGVDELSSEDPLIAYVEDHLSRWPADIPRVMPEDWIIFVCEEIWPVPQLVWCNTLALGPDSYLAEDYALVLEPQYAKNLTTITIREHYDLDRVLGAIALSEELLRCTTLRIPHSFVHDDALELLMGAEHLQSVTTLDLRYGQSLLGDEAMGMLAKLPLARHLETVYLQSNSLGPAGLEHLVMREGARHLRFLDLRYNEDLGREGARLLATSPHLTNLEWLSIRDTDIGGARDVLANSETLSPSIRKFWRRP